jgi:hypothetical protein
MPRRNLRANQYEDKNGEQDERVEEVFVRVEVGERSKMWSSRVDKVVERLDEFVEGDEVAVDIRERE